ncbi:hypothetical protein FIM08_02590 [SAR202 cluster bacterium AC-647-N09_OGT_505m]|nr:hypothetical protein [SAR202 cluster bacterium AC-647-N09_OGT_505m]
MLLVPSVYEPPASTEEGGAISQRYLGRMQYLIASLESGLMPTKHISNKVAIGSTIGSPTESYKQSSGFLMALFSLNLF